MSRKIAPIVENVTEATAACLITMVQGNILGLTLRHWMIASQTGVVPGPPASLALTVARNDNRWVIAAVLGVSTAIVDYAIHPGAFGPALMEAVVTGVGAAVLSYAVNMTWNYVRRRQAA